MAALAITKRMIESAFSFDWGIVSKADKARFLLSATVKAADSITTEKKASMTINLFNQFNFVSLQT